MMHENRPVNTAIDHPPPASSTATKPQSIRQRRRPPPVVTTMTTETHNGVGNVENLSSSEAQTAGPQVLDTVSASKHSNEKDTGPVQTPTPVEANGHTSITTADVADVIGNTKMKDLSPDDPHLLVIDSLRSQISDLISQVTQLNGKLVKSYDRVSDLEDELHFTSQNLRQSSIKISQLELERTQHLAALNTGLLVEKAHVTTELNRLMERATDEAARRGQAETARATIEKELDDLSANLFAQANTMVAEARLQRAMSERKVEVAENALRGAEEAISGMQIQMQFLREEKDKGDQEAARLKALMGKGKWVESTPPSYSMATLRLLSLHSPYQEFLLFVAHLRSVRPATPTAPLVTTFLPLPFLSRIQTEDSDPTLRLDFAPSLNWLSRRSVLSAIHTGQLTIEPMAFTALLLESTSSSLQSMIPGSHNNISCALCGASIVPSSENHTRHIARQNSGSQWSSALFKNPLSVSSAPSPPLTPPHSNTQAPDTSPAQPQHVYVFRLPQTQNNSITTQGQQRLTNYPLCPSGWCLARLRTTCSLWAFIRTGILDKVWEEEVPDFVSQASTPTKSESGNKGAAPPVPPRRRSKMSNLWGMASGALSSRTSSPKGKSDPGLGPDSRPDSIDERKETLPAVPLTPTPHRILAPPPAKRPVVTTSAPPPLPRRSVERQNASREGSPAVKARDLPEPPAKRASRSGSDATQGSTPTITKANLHVEGAQPVSAQNGIEASNSTSSLAPSTTPSSREEYTTPVEELSSLALSNQTEETKVSSPTATPATVVQPLPKRNSLPTPLSPRAILLPDSRPGSPLNGVRSRPTSMQVQIAGHLVEEVKSRSGSPVSLPVGPPPPLPRRAAARRPVPVPPSGGPQVHASGSPERVMSRPQTPADGHIEKVEVRRNSGDKLEGKPEGHVNGVPPSSEPSQEQLAIEVKAPAPVPPPLPRRREEPRPLSAPVEKPTLPPVTISTTVNELEKTVSSNSSAVEEEFAHGPLVGDATREERTWKEITRLREDMFWARVGALR